MRVIEMAPIADVVDEIHDLASLLVVVLAGPDAETVLDGIYRVVLEIRERAALLRAACEGI